MTWLEHHRESERLASEAEVALRRGDTTAAKELFGQAAEAEQRAFADLDISKTRTIGVSALSTAALYYKAGRLAAAEAFAYNALASGTLADFAVDELRLLLQSIWSEQVRERADVGFAPGQVIVSVSGGEIVQGGAPLDLIVEKVQTLQSFLYRTAEMLRGFPHRKRGAPIREIQDTCRPWLFQTAPGSYQFAVAVQEPRQLSLLEREGPTPTAVAERFLRILRASVEETPEDLSQEVTDVEYRTTFLKLTRNLAPTGKTFSQLEVRSSGEERPLTLVPSTRSMVAETIRRSRPAPPGLPEEEQAIQGILRAVHLDEDWIEVTVEGRHIRITDVGEAVDDLIGPMVNRPVVVQVVRGRGQKLRFRDIEPDD